MMALDQNSWLDPLSWFACGRCGTRTNSEWICLSCNMAHNDLWEPQLDKEPWIGQEISDIIDNGYKIGLLGLFTTPKTQWTDERTTEISIVDIKGMRWKYQRLFIRFGTDEIKLETNGEKIKNYARKVGTKNRRWKWYRWEIWQPAKTIREFLEEKLWAKFAES